MQVKSNFVKEHKIVFGVIVNPNRILHPEGINLTSMGPLMCTNQRTPNTNTKYDEYFR